MGVGRLPRNSPPSAAARRRCRAAALGPLVVAALLAGCASPTPGSAPARPAVPAALRAALDGLHFSDVTRSAGLASPQSAHLLVGPDSMTGGVAACDLFGNGLIDFYVTRVGLPNELFRNNGNGTFTNVARRAGVQGTDWRAGYSGATCGDLNGDGRPDLYVTSAGDTGNLLYLNNGNGTFTNVTRQAGLDLPPTDAADPSLMFGSAFGDYNHDGRLDIVTTQWNQSVLAELGGGDGYGGGPSHAPVLPGGPCATAAARAAMVPGSPIVTRTRLYRNDGNGPGGVPHFTDVTAAMGLDVDSVLGFTPTFVDLTGDGWDDLVISGDGCTSQVYLNDDGRRFVDVTAASGADTAQNGMGSAFPDFAGDGRPDWFETAISYPGRCINGNGFVGCSGNRLYANTGTGTFTDATGRFGVRRGGWGWGAAAADFANTGRLDLAEVAGELWAPQDEIGGPANARSRFFIRLARGSPRLWLNDGATPFPQVAGLVGLTAVGQEKAVVPVDYRNDGKLGLFITDTGADPVLYANDTTNTNGWLDLRLHDPTTANTFGVGAEVKVVSAGTGRHQADTVLVQEAELLDGGSFESSDPLELHFGFGPHVARVAAIDVYWPGQSVPQVLHDVRVDRVLTVTRR